MAVKELWKGNEAMSETALRAGCRFFSGYPITPQTPITEYLSWRLPEVEGVFIQAESELSAATMLLGASIAGVRALTATAGPGLSLMTESLSCLASGRLPAVIVDVQRGGAATGNLQGAQSDYNMVTKSLGHGGLKGLVYGPSTVEELCDIIYDAWDKAEKYRTQVFILSDASLGQMMEPVDIKPFKQLDEARFDLPYVIGRAQSEKKVIQDTPYAGPYTTFAENLDHNYRKYNEMYEEWKQTEVSYENYMMDDADYVIAAWGIAARIAKSAIRNLRKKGIKVGMIRPISLFPFPEEPFNALDPKKIKGLLVVEMAIPPLFYYDVKAQIDKNIPIYANLHCGGYLSQVDEIEEDIIKMIGGEKNGSCL
jgi:2-oxoglutarate ferredoxin oxidoreductase subunit alpha